jgi:hypothetical protein
MIGFVISACGPGQVVGPTLPPTLTSAPEATFTATAVPTDTATLEPTPIPTSNEPGGSFETAIVLQASNEREGIPMEYQWLNEHYPGYQLLRQAFNIFNDKPYDIMTIRTADDLEKVIYFDISSFYGKF